MTDPISRLFTSKVTASIIGLKEQTLATWRMNRYPDQPPYIRVGKRAIRYREEDLLAWIEDRRRTGQNR